MHKFVGIVMLSWSVGVIMHANFGNIVRETDNLIAKCEEQLPRNEFCVLVAKPIKQEK